MSLIYTYYPIETEIQSAVSSGLSKVCGGTAEELDYLFNPATSFLMSLASPPHIWTRVSPYWPTLTGWSEVQLLADPWVDRVHPDEQSQTNDAITNLVPETQIVEIKLRFQKSDLSYLNIVFNCLKCADGKLYGVHYEPAGVDPVGDPQEEP